ncbi:phage integrase family protein [Cupriavidus basilensis]
MSSLEQLGQGYPQAQHEVSLWFKPSLARRLKAANLRQISDLTALSNQRGSSWWRTVPHIGAQSAEIITNWLMRQRQPLGEVAIRAYVLPLRLQAQRKALLPLILGPRMPIRCRLSAMLAPDPDTVVKSALTADLVFVQGWLQARAPHTRSSYRREAERLLLWSAGRGKDLGMLEAEDIDAYEAFLADPQPSSFWCGPSGPRDQNALAAL